MPDLNKLPVPLHTGGEPIHVDYDNIPLEALKVRDEIINGEVENHAAILRDGQGTQGTLSNRLNQSLDEDGSLLVTAIDDAAHNIAEHTDGSKTIDTDLLGYFKDTLNYSSLSNPVEFVRMLQSERDKLALIANEATNFGLDVETPSVTVVLDATRITLGESASIGWIVEAPNVVKPLLKISTDFAHRHYYDLEPITEDYQSFKVTSINTPYIEGSLRVYINGMRLNTDYSVYVPGNVTLNSWTLNKFTPDFEAGTFELENIITSDDIIRIDFDISLTT